MKKWKLRATGGCLDIFSSLYTAFVVQTLWNWFAVAAFRVPAISYWMMWGLMLIIGLIFSFETSFPEAMHKVSVDLHLEKLVRACVPEEEREILKEEINNEESNVLAMPLGKAIGRFCHSTTALTMGFVVHTFLA